METLTQYNETVRKRIGTDLFLKFQIYDESGNNIVPSSVTDLTVIMNIGKKLSYTLEGNYICYQLIS